MVMKLRIGYQLSPCVTAMALAGGGLNILRGDLCVQDSTQPGSRLQVPDTVVPGHWNPRGEEAPAQPPPRTAETKEKPAENKHSRHQHQHLQHSSQSSRSEIIFVDIGSFNNRWSAQAQLSQILAVGVGS